MASPVRARSAAPLLWLVLLAGCDSGGRQAQPTVSPLPQLQQGDGRIQWQGLLACADCDGIQTTLLLQRSGGDRSYTLTETYLADADAVRFVETGDWRTEADLLRLLGTSGGVRVFAVLPDGRLQPRDGRGRRFASRGDDVLMPITAQDTP
ncbi:MAG: copper resistance protein NlpE [Gammaproteobacteria bacterium]|nr:copper resistance protein NlpE [Gammaproteobacteria bacterium]